jgi:hypothetical protein
MRGEVGTKTCSSLKTKVTSVTARFRPNLQWLWRMGTKCHMWCLSHPTAIGGGIGTKNCLGVKSKCQSLLRDCDQTFTGCGEWGRSHPAAMRGEVGKKNCFGLKSKVAFITARFRPNVQCLWGMCRQCHVWYTSHPAGMTGERITRNFLVWRVTWPSLLPEFDQTCSGCGGCRRTATCNIWVTPLLREARMGRNLLWASRVKCLSLLPDFYRT